MIEQLFAWCYETPVLAFLRDSRFGMPISQSFHIFGITVLLGTAVAWNLRLTGLGFRETPLKRMVDDLWPWAKGALAVVIVSGLLVFIVDPTRYAANTPFRAKMLMLCLAIAFQFTVFRRTVTAPNSETLPASRRWLVSTVSLTLWFSVGWAGRFIAFL